MTDEVLFDTNILCYAYDSSEPTKREKSEELVEQALQGRIRGVVSNQILVELFNTLTRKMGVTDEKARIIVKTLIASEYLKKIEYTHETMNKALNNLDLSGAPFLDILIAETMKENGIKRIITENERDFGRIRGIEVINPFKTQ